MWRPGLGSTRPPTLGQVPEPKVSLTSRGAALGIRRDQLGLSMEAVAREAKIPYGRYRRIERGEVGSVRRSELEGLATVLQLDIVERDDQLSIVPPDPDVDRDRLEARLARRMLVLGPHHREVLSIRGSIANLVLTEERALIGRENAARLSALKGLRVDALSLYEALLPDLDRVFGSDHRSSSPDVWSGATSCVARSGRPARPTGNASWQRHPTSTSDRPGTASSSATSCSTRATPSARVAGESRRRHACHTRASTPTTAPSKSSASA